MVSHRFLRFNKNYNDKKQTNKIKTRSSYCLGIGYYLSLRGRERSRPGEGVRNQRRLVLFTIKLS